MKKDREQFYQEVARYYDGQREDINLILATKDKIVHHHSGICEPSSIFPDMSEEELLAELHKQETALTLRGLEYLGVLGPEMTGLDAGCGRGGSSLLVNKLHGCFMKGVSLSSYQVKFANRIAMELGVSEKVKFYEENLLKLPFGQDNFDFIWACESTEHVPDLEEMFLEFRRVAKANARLIIIAGCGNPDHPEGAEFIKGINEWYHILIHSPSEYTAAAEKTGWKLIANVDLTPETIPYWHLRERSVLKTGVEKFVKGYESGAGEYRLLPLSS
ncbi:MAG: methyltransferase domain-containing protein [Patescibacteria group bacterium]